MSLSFLAYSVNTVFSVGWIGHWLHGDVEQFIELVEDDVVLLVKGIGADRLGPEVAFDVMPVDARTTDRDRGGAIGLLVGGVGHPLHRQHVAVHAVVVVEKAVADEDFGFGKIRPQRRDERLGLRICHARSGRDPAQGDEGDRENTKQFRHDFPLIR